MDQLLTERIKMVDGQTDWSGRAWGVTPPNLDESSRPVCTRTPISTTRLVLDLPMKTSGDSWVSDRGRSFSCYGNRSKA